MKKIDFNKRLEGLKVLSPCWLEAVFNPADLLNKEFIFESIKDIGLKALNEEFNTTYSYINFRYDHSKDLLFKECIWNFINENYEYDKFFFVKQFGAFEETLCDYIPDKLWDKHIK